MSEPVEVTQEQFDEVKRLLSMSRKCLELSKLPGLTLAKKLALQGQSKELREQAMSIGR